VIELGKAFFSSIYTPGVINVEAISCEF